MNKTLIEPQAEEKPISPAYLFVSLYLVILAFFIMLNAISILNKDDKEGKVSQLRESFINESKGKVPKIQITSYKGNDDVVMKKYFAPIGKLIKEAVTLVDVGISTREGILIVEIPISRFFENELMDIKPEQDMFIEKLVDEIVQLNDNVKIDIELILGSPEFSAIPDAQNSLSLARIGNLARILVKSGVDDKGIYAGIDMNYNPDILKMSFILRNIKDSEINPIDKMEENES